MVRGTRYGDALRRSFVHERSAARTWPSGIRAPRRSVVASVLVVAAVVVAACGSNGSSTTSSSTSGADVAAAKAGVAEFTGHPSPFPVTEPLSKPLPAGSKFVYLQAADPIGALLGDLIKPAVQAIGGEYVTINAGSTAASAQKAASSALAERPTVLLIPAFLPSSFGGKLDELKAAGTKIVGAGMDDWAKYGIDWCVGCTEFVARSATIMADWVVANKGAKAKPVFYTVPELAFTAGMYEAFKARMAELCSSCTVRNVPIGVATIGSTAPQTIVNDLQSHADTNVAALATMDAATGLPAAEKSAGVNVTSIGSSPTPQNLQDMKAGDINAGVAVDLAAYVWTMVDAGARLSIGQKPQASSELPPVQLLESKDITFNPQKGWPGYPDFAARFTKLWHP